MFFYLQVKAALELVEEAVMGTVNERIVVMKLSLTLLTQTFVALPNTITVADYAAFYIVSLVFVCLLNHIHEQNTFKGYNGYVNVVRWYSYMQEVYADLCKELAIPHIDFDYEKIDIHFPIPRPSESKKAPKKETKKEGEAPKAAAAPAAAPAEEEDVISKLDIRVGRIIRAWNHPESDK